MIYDVYAVPRTFIASIGQDNGRAFRDAEFRFPGEDAPEDADAFADRLDALAAEHPPTHGRYFPHIEDDPDLGTVAATVADAVRRSAGPPVYVRHA